MIKSLVICAEIIMATERKRRKLDNLVLPQEVWCIIFSYLPKESRKNATITCKLWFEIIRGDSRLSGNVSIPWIKLQSSRFDWDNWPCLKTLAITNISLPSPKLALMVMKDIDFKKCPSLEKVTFGVNFDMAELYTVMKTTATKTNAATTGENMNTETENISTSKKLMKNIATVLALVFNPKFDIDWFKLEHIDKLEIHMRSQRSNNIERNLKIMDMIGKAAINLRSLIVGCESFYYPEFFETGFKNFFTSSLKVFTLKNDCFAYSQHHQGIYVHGDYVNRVNTFFKSLNENCPNLSSLNLGSAHQLRCLNCVEPAVAQNCVPLLQRCLNTHLINSWRKYDHSKIFSMAGFEMVKELDVDFTFFHIGKGFAHFNWFFGLINDCNNIEKLSLNGLMFPFFGTTSYFRYFIASIKEKFKNLKKCPISFQEGFEQHFENPFGENCEEYVSALAKDLDRYYIDFDEKFAYRSIEFKVLVQANYETTDDGICFQIIKMPFKNSVISKID